MPPADWMQGVWARRLHSLNPIISTISPKCSILSMPEVPDAGKNHRHSKPVCRLDHLGVADRTPRLNDRRSACLGNGFKTIREGEKSVRGGDGALERKDGLHRAKPCSINPAHLAGANAYRLAMAIAYPGVDD